ncbi:MAG TPA: glycogen-debranching protein [Kofleriaceae bacterium]|nr:glycogen-debranching protein [Kofleriaceae bacterium]
MTSWAAAEGLAYPLGVSWCAEDRAYNFALYSKHATSVRLLLFGDDVETPRAEIELDPLTNKSGRVWHCRVAAAIADGCRYYGYRVDGPAPAGPFEVHAFHPQKLLLDPYARCIVFPPSFDPTAAADDRPNLGVAALGVIDACDPEFDWRDDSRPHHEADTVIYELHVRGFTQHPSSAVSDAARGSFSGVIEKIPYLRELGVTVVELMPVFQFDPQTRDFWGYMPMSFFAPHRAYAVGAEPIRAFRSMVAALHRAGIEVVLDVVYNHTAEGGAGGPVYSFKGLDNSTYYLMRDGGYADYTGTGNSINANNRYVRKMILDSMRYWVRDMHVDGFRFDLASVFARNPDGSINFEDPPIFGDISSDPDFERVRLIAEPWDAAGAYELGRAFPGTTWLQWNSRFRDDVRRFVRGDPGMTASLMQRIYGSDDLFPDSVIDAYHAYQSINHITSHDGFTLHDLVAYERKRNEANGHGNLDGAAENWSSNCGWEGDAGAPDLVLALRERQAKNFIALLLLANGTPMLRAGDEFLHSQGGNNNPYNQDNETSWLDWRGRDAHAGFWRFVQQMIAFRKRHPSLARSRFWRSDVRWFGPDGAADTSQPRVAWWLRGTSLGDADLYVMVNAGAEPVPFVVQVPGGPWRMVIDTSRGSPGDITLDHPCVVTQPAHVVGARSVVVLERGGRPPR